jgi:hypothetical protein
LSRCEQLLALLCTLRGASAEHAPQTIETLQLVHTLLAKVMHGTMPSPLIASLSTYFVHMSRADRAVTHLLGQACLCVTVTASNSEAIEHTSSVNHLMQIVHATALIDDDTLTSVRCTYLLRMARSALGDGGAHRMYTIGVCAVRTLYAVFDTLPASRERLGRDLVVLLRTSVSATDGDSGDEQQASIGAYCLLGSSSKQLRRTSVNLCALLVQKSAGRNRLAVIQYMLRYM